MYQKVKAYVSKHHMLEKSDKVIIGVSGGADSICLLFMLLELKTEIGFEMEAVHVHHGIRGAQADRDQAYVEEVCRQQNVALHLCREDVKAYALQHKMTVEEAGREVRRKVFMEVMNQIGGTKIALAHHQNDNAETLILNLCRGTGLRGIGGMREVNGPWIRPLLCLDRRQIESYLSGRGISYCTDETNLEDAYTRNKIRNHVIPYLEQEVNGQAVAHMDETMCQMRVLANYVEQETQRYRQRCTAPTEEGILLVKEKYREVPEALRPYVIYEILCGVSGRCKDMESVHVRLVTELFDRQVGREIKLPYQVSARRCYEGIVFVTQAERSETSAGAQEPHMSLRVFDKTPDVSTFPETLYTKWFDYDIIKNTVKMRHREAGDYLTIDQDGGTQKLKQYFINEKIPQQDRDGIWLVADGHHIMWVVGYRQNQKYQVTGQTRRILEIAIDGGIKDGRDCESVIA